MRTRAEKYQKFLVKWRGQPLADRSWILKEELIRLNPELYSDYIQQNSSEKNSFESGRVDGDHSISTPVTFAEIVTRGRPPEVQLL